MIIKKYSTMKINQRQTLKISTSLLLAVNDNFLLITMMISQEIKGRIIVLKFLLKKIMRLFEQSRCRRQGQRSWDSIIAKSRVTVICLCQRDRSHHFPLGGVKFHRTLMGQTPLNPVQFQIVWTTQLLFQSLRLKQLILMNY